MYKYDYGKYQQNSSTGNLTMTASDNFPNNAHPAANQAPGTFAVRPGQAPQQQWPAQQAPQQQWPPQQAANSYGQQPYYPQHQPGAAATGHYPGPYYQQNQSQYQLQAAYQQQAYQPGSQSQLHAASGWQPSVSSVPQQVQYQPTAGNTTKKQRITTKSFRVQLIILIILHATCAGTCLGMEIWAIHIKAWLSSAALGIWAALVFFACGVVSVVLLCRPKRQATLNVAFGFMIGGAIVAVGLCAIAGVGILFENNVNYTLRDNYWPYRVPTHIVKMIFASIEIAVCIWELLIIKVRFEKKPAKKQTRTINTNASYQHVPQAVGPRSGSQPDILSSGLGMPSGIQLSSTGPQPMPAPQRVFKALPDAPGGVSQSTEDVTNGRRFDSDGNASDAASVELDREKPPARPPPRSRNGSASKLDEVEEPVTNVQQFAPVASAPPRPTKRRTTAGKTPIAQPTEMELHSEDDRVADDSEKLPPRPSRNKPTGRNPPPPPPKPVDDPFNAPLSRSSQATSGSQKRLYYYSDAAQ